MPRRPQEPNPNQPGLFVTNEYSGNLYPDQALVSGLLEVSAPVPTDPLVDPNPAPSVDIAERNAHLQNMLKRLNIMSRATGMQIAAGTGLRRELESRYDDVDRVVGNTAERSERKHREAREHYAKAFGTQALIESGLMSREDAEAMEKTSYYREVLPTFADAKGKKRRDAMQSWLNHQEKKLTGKPTRRPKHPLPKPPEVV